MTPRRSRLRRVLKWAGLVVCVLIVAAWCVSLFSSDAHRIVGDYWIELNCGAVEFIDWNKHKAAHYGLLGKWHYGGPLSVRERSGLVRPNRSILGLAAGVLIPLWMPLVAVGLPTALLWYRDRRPPKGHCQTCGYNLSGLPEPRCPECGKPFTRPSP